MKLLTFIRIGKLEAISYLLLLFVAMPMKYFLAMPLFVKYMGWVHGLLFMAYLSVLLYLTIDRSWPIGKSFLLFIASLLPFGPFIAEPWLKRWASKESL